MKSYTDLEQSRKLADILPLESADMYYINSSVGKIHIGGWKDEMHDEDDIPCWSLAALLEVLLNPKIYLAIGGKWHCECWKYVKDVKRDESSYIGCTKASNSVDACYEMIIQLNKLKML